MPRTKLGSLNNSHYFESDNPVMSVPNKINSDMAYFLMFGYHSGDDRPDTQTNLNMEMEYRIVTTQNA